MRSITNTEIRYGWATIVLHWLIGVIFIGQFVLGFAMVRVASQRTSFELIQLLRASARRQQQKQYGQRGSHHAVHDAPVIVTAIRDSSHLIVTANRTCEVVASRPSAVLLLSAR